MAENLSPPCSELSLALGEDLPGTAVHAVNWLLIEHPGPWGAKAPREVRWPDGLGTSLLEYADRLGIRLGLIRRPGGAPEERRSPAAPTGRTQVLMAHTGPARPWLLATVLDDPRHALDLDLPLLAAGLPPPSAQPCAATFLVCAHSGRDLCCARYGRPVAAALAARFPDQTWESTHLGGHRFAATFACLPHGFMFGRVTPDQAVTVADAYLDGEFDTTHYRGRACWPGPVQAAEAWLRERCQLRALDAVTVLSHRQDGSLTEVELRVEAEPRAALWCLEVETAESSAARRLSCSKAAEEIPPGYRVTVRSNREVPQGPAEAR